MSDNSATRAYVFENGKSSYSVTINVSGYTIEGDEPVSYGGGGLGPAPYDVLLAALGECTAMTVRWYALQQKWPLEKVEVELTHHKEGLQDKARKTDVFTKRIELHGEGLSDAQRAKLVEIAAKCPIQRTLEGTPVIRTLP